MSNQPPAPNDSNDFVAGYVIRPHKETGEPMLLLYIKLYDLDPETGLPKQVGTFTNQEGKTFPRYRAVRTLRLPISTLTKVVGGEAKRCQVFERIE